MSEYDNNLPFTPEDDDIVIVKHLTKHFPIKTDLFGKVLSSVKAVNDISFKLKKGTTLGVVGESGCGKTTMGRTMLRLYDITSGEVIYRGLRRDTGSTRPQTARSCLKSSRKRGSTLRAYRSRHLQSSAPIYRSFSRIRILLSARV